MSLGVVLRRQPSRHVWQDQAWRPVAVIAGPPPSASWRLLREAGGGAEYLAATLPLDLYPGETSGYLQNLAQKSPVVYVVMRPRGAEDPGPADCPIRPFHVTVCPFEAQDYLDGDDQVEVVPMPAAIAAWVDEYARRHHVERPFKKRQRKEAKAERPEDAGPASGTRSR